MKVLRNILTLPVKAVFMLCFVFFLMVLLGVISLLIEVMPERKGG